MLSPVLILTFNRPDLARRTAEAVKAANPPAVFLYSDGPRENHPGDSPLIAETRKILDEIFADYSGVNRRYLSSNSGLFPGVPEAIDWFFDHVEEGVILEDDCLPGADFFYFCDELLERFREFPRVFCISGDNSIGLPVESDHSYGFLRDPLIWGWATWKSRWEKYDRNWLIWPELRGTAREKFLAPDRAERKARRHLYDFYTSFENWDFKWVLTVFGSDGLAVFPRENLVSNLGIGRPDATHTVGPSKRSAVPSGQIFPLVHPDRIDVGAAANSVLVERGIYGAQKYRLMFHLKKWARKLIRRLNRGRERP